MMHIKGCYSVHQMCFKPTYLHRLIAVVGWDIVRVLWNMKGEVILATMYN
jgi:hypothetical protein